MTQADAIREASYDFTAESQKSKIDRTYTKAQLQEMTKPELIALIARVHPGNDSSGRVGAGVFRGLIQLDKTTLVAAVFGLRFIEVVSSEQVIIQPNKPTRLLNID